MTPLLRIRKRDRQPGWLTLDFRDDEAIGAPVVIPTFGPDHRGGMDCWCCPENEEGVIVHNAQN
jgi:hypothetical protein